MIRRVTPDETPDDDSSARPWNRRVWDPDRAEPVNWAAARTAVFVGLAASLIVLRVLPSPSNYIVGIVIAVAVVSFDVVRVRRANRRRS